MNRLRAGCTVYHGDDADRTSAGRWVDGDLFSLDDTGARYLRLNGAWSNDGVLDSLGLFNNWATVTITA